MNIRRLNHNIFEAMVEIPNFSGTNAHDIFARLYEKSVPAFLFESKDISPIYGRLSMIGMDPVIKISGKDDHFAIELLHGRGKYFFEQLNNEDFDFCDSIERSERIIAGEVKVRRDNLEETQRSMQRNITRVIRRVLKKFEQNHRSLLGLYGVFSYDCIRLFEEIGESLPSNNINDFTLYLFDTFVFFDHLKGRNEVVVFRSDEEKAQRDAEALQKRIVDKMHDQNEYTSIADEVLCADHAKMEIADASFVMSQSEYEEMVEIGRAEAEHGELFEVVFSNILKARFRGNPFDLYKIYREKNPSPYLFFIDLGEEQLVGASPEMMVRVEDGIAHMRPISGTVKRGADPIEDHENMMSLLASPKEKAELDMLVDLGRNDLSRVCDNVRITDYRFVEKYSRVMHTVAHVSGNLRDGYAALDALIACMNAGTLTGAPKVAAMRLIETHEKERRGYYGGAIGYLTFSGEMDTGIIIRTAHIRDGQLRFQVGATLLYDSSPSDEYNETINKAQAFLECIR